MDEENADCSAIISCTAEALDNEMLEILLISAQQVNLEICVKYAVRRKVVCEHDGDCVAEKVCFRSLKRLLRGQGIYHDVWPKHGRRTQASMAIWFPHVRVSVKNQHCANTQI